MRKLIAIALCASVLAFIINACTKTDFEKHSHEADRNLLFFQKTKPVTPQIQKLYDGLKKQNEIYSFVNNLPKHSGHPVWDKVQFFNKKKTNVAARGGETGEEEAVAYIPMSEDEEYISSLLKVEETEDSIYTYSVEIYTNDFFYEKMHEANITKEEAEYLLGLFMYMDKETFEATEFENIPTAAFEGDAHFDSIPESTTNITLEYAERPTNCIEEKWVSIVCGTKDWCKANGSCDAVRGCFTGQCYVVMSTRNICDYGSVPVIPGVVVPTNPNGPPSTGPYGGGGGTGTNPDKNPPCGGAWYRVKPCTPADGADTTAPKTPCEVAHGTAKSIDSIFLKAGIEKRLNDSIPNWKTLTIEKGFPVMQYIETSWEPTTDTYDTAFLNQFYFHYISSGTSDSAVNIEYPPSNGIKVLKVTVHTHPSNKFDGPSAADVFSTIATKKDDPYFEAMIIASASGDFYALTVTDFEKANNFLDSMSVYLSGNSWNQNSIVGKDFMDAFNHYEKNEFKNSPNKDKLAQEMANAVVLAKYSGVTMNKRDANGNFKPMVVNTSQQLVKQGKKSVQKTIYTKDCQ